MHLNFDMNMLKFALEDFAPEFKENSDFWRMHLELNGKKDIGVYSFSQKPCSVTKENGIYKIEYNQIITENGDILPINLILFAKPQKDEIIFSAKITNNSSAMILELQYPFFEFTKINGDFDEDVLYIPAGLGRRVENPHKMVEDCHTEYKGADYKNIWYSCEYPGPLSMGWLSVMSGEKLLYLGSHCVEYTTKTLNIGCEPRTEKTDSLILTISSYPALRQDETISYEEFCIGLYIGDWRIGADRYRSFAEETFLNIRQLKPSVYNMNGWQRIILKHQYGEVFNKYEDLPRIYAEGAKYGIRTILLFGWWEEGMDNGYPNYLPSDELGGAEALKKAIKEINEMGGNVILYANGHIIDKSTQYYKAEGYKYTTKDIDGNEYMEKYYFANNGTLLNFGHKTFVCGCHGTKEWQEKLDEIAQRHLDLGSNGTFFDQLSTGFHLCFDNSHRHKNRIDLDPTFRYNWMKTICQKLNDDELFGSELIADRLSQFVDFTHGFGRGMKYEEKSYPYIFRYTFPEYIVSNRLIHDTKEGYKKHLNYAFVMGLVFDISIYRGRAKSIECEKAYAEHIKYLIDIKDKYRDYFMLGKFDIIDTVLPCEVYAARYIYNGKSIIAVCNNSNKKTDFCGRTINPDQVLIIEE